MMSYELLEMNEKRNVLKDKTFSFAVEIIKNHKILVEKKEFVMSKQLLRSGTAIGALVREAGNAESRADFIHKLGISQKECDETIYWLELLKEADYITHTEFNNLSQQATELLKIIRSSILTAKGKIKNS
jgi:four helix bundle protein